MGYKMKGFSYPGKSPAKQKKSGPIPLPRPSEGPDITNDDLFIKQDPNRSGRPIPLPTPDVRKGPHLSLKQIAEKRRKKEEEKKSPTKHGTTDDFLYGRSGHNPDIMEGKHEDSHTDRIKLSKEEREEKTGVKEKPSPNKQKPKKSTESKHGQLSDAEREYQFDLDRYEEMYGKKPVPKPEGGFMRPPYKKPVGPTEGPHYVHGYKPKNKTKK